MLILTAVNVTRSITGDSILARPDGMADYDVWIGINQHCIWRGSIFDFKRDQQAAALLRRIADEMEKH